MGNAHNPLARSARLLALALSRPLSRGTNKYNGRIVSGAYKSTIVNVEKQCPSRVRLQGLFLLSLLSQILKNISSPNGEPEIRTSSPGDSLAAVHKLRSAGVNPTAYACVFLCICELPVMFLRVCVCVYVYELCKLLLMRLCVACV